VFHLDHLTANWSNSPPVVARAAQKFVQHALGGSVAAWFPLDTRKLRFLRLYWEVGAKSKGGFLFSAGQKTPDKTPFVVLVLMRVGGRRYASGPC